MKKASELPPEHIDSSPGAILDVREFDAGASLNQDYSAALEHIYGHLDFERIDPATFSSVERNLDDYREFLGILGDPQLAQPAVHITGTRGKGSCLAHLEAILLAAGYRTGATVSPHLVEVRERIRINGNDLSRDDFAGIHAQLRPVADRRNAARNFRTVFELVTALAFLAFRNHRVDIALVEVGLGGRLDATNVIQPELAVITRIGLDHMKVLGETIEEIAADKAHIIKPGVPSVIAPQPPEALRCLQEHIEAVGSVPWRIGHEARFTFHETSVEGTRFDLDTPGRSYRDLVTPMLGAHQAENAAVAVLSAERLSENGRFNITEDAVRAGLRQTKWPGRGEVLSTDPVVLLDGAHTPQGGAALAGMLESCWPGRKRLMVLGFNRDKDVKGFLDCFPPPDQVIATAARTPRAMPAGEVAELVRAHGWSAEAVEIESAPERALLEVKHNQIVVITGSLYVVGAFRRQWSNRT